MNKYSEFFKILNEGQAKLNDTIWANRPDNIIDRDKCLLDGEPITFDRMRALAAETEGNHELIHHWAVKFSMYLQDEITELMEVRFDYHKSNGNDEYVDKARIELIDCFCFIACLGSVIDFNFNDDSIDNYCEKEKENNIFNLQLSVQSFMKKFNFKYWSNDDKDYMDSKDWKEANEKFIEIVIEALVIAKGLDLGPNELKDIYTQKLDVNLERQRQKYSKKNKIEGDDSHIKVN